MAVQLDFTLKRSTEIASDRRGATGGSPPKTQFSSISLVAAPTAPAPPASAELGLITGTRIGADVDLLVQLATGATTGRATTTPL